MTVEKVREMRRLHEEEGKSYSELAKMFGCSQGSAASICQYVNWAWVL